MPKDSLNRGQQAAFNPLHQPGRSQTAFWCHTSQSHTAAFSVLAPESWLLRLSRQPTSRPTMRFSVVSRPRYCWTAERTSCHQPKPNWVVEAFCGDTYQTSLYQVIDYILRTTYFQISLKLAGMIHPKVEIWNRFVVIFKIWWCLELTCNLIWTFQQPY